MPRIYRLVAALLSGATVLATVGCGGGSSSGSGSLNLYFTDAFGDQYTQVWTTIHRVEIARADSNFQTVFEDAEGMEMNLTDLADTAELVGTASIPAGLYTRARVTLRNTMRLMERTGTTSDVPLQIRPNNGFSPAPAGQCIAEFPINLTVAQGASADMAVDFDVASFQMSAGSLQARIRQLDQNQLQTRPRRGRLVGTVTNLVPDTAFDLLLRNNRSVPVLLSADTTVVSAATGADVELANGQKVLVFGTLDPGILAVKAMLIIVLDGPPAEPRPAHIRGKVVDVDTASKSFVVEPINTFMNFRPEAFHLKVLTDAQTAFAFVPRKPATFDDLQVGGLVDVLGRWDSTVPAIAARRVLILGK